MKHIIEKISLRHWGLFFTAVSLAVIAAVYISQYGFGMHPCHLCLLQRIPFYISAVLGVGLITFSGNQKIARILLSLLLVTFAAGTYLAVFHMGVEYKWWTYNSGCTGGSAFKAGASVEEMMAALKAAPTVRCDERVTFLFGMTMAFYNVLTSVGLTVLSGVALISSRNALRA